LVEQDGLADSPQADDQYALGGITQRDSRNLSLPAYSGGGLAAPGEYGFRTGFIRATYINLSDLIEKR